MKIRPPSSTLQNNKRRLTQEERQLWNHVARDIHPLKHTKRIPLAEKQEDILLPSFPPQPKKTGSSIPSSFSNASQAPLQKNTVLPSLDTQTLKALKKGRKNVEAKLDLHGLYQQEAYSALRSFLFRSHTQSKSVVLVVTGKGSSLSPHSRDFLSFESKGVLRRMLPHWLASPELHPIVIGYEEASIRHGGGGAFYIRLRKPTKLR